jgi:hypothetical protein
MTEISNRQRQILVGTLLGDGCLERNKQNFRLKVDHGLGQKDYVWWKHKELSGLVNGQPKLIQALDKRSGKVYGHWRFNSKTCEIFTKHHLMFYRNRKKIVPKFIVQLLTAPVALAVWFMDDGFNRKDCLGKYLNTQAYTLEEHGLLQGCLQRNFGLTTKIHWAAGRPRLYIDAPQAERFVKLIQHEIIPSMMYKISNPVTTGIPGLRTGKEDGLVNAGHNTPISQPLLG